MKFKIGEFILYYPMILENPLLNEAKRIWKDILLEYYTELCSWELGELLGCNEDIDVTDVMKALEKVNRYILDRYLLWSVATEDEIITYIRNWVTSWVF